MKKLVIITGVSGSGKSILANTFEDINFFVSDNITPQILPDMAKLISTSETYKGFAAVIDLRCEDNFNELILIYEQMKKNPIEGFEKPIIIFLNCKPYELLRRFKETRRKHPLTNSVLGVEGAIKLEMELFAPVLNVADCVIDTSNLEAEDLRRKIKTMFNVNGKEQLNITVTAFGYKYGMPLDADIVFDVRFLKNPFWEPTLKNFTGRDKCVQDYVLSDQKSQDFLKRLYNLVDFSVPEYAKEGKAYLNIAIGCTGGKHRSITIANELTGHLKKLGYMVRLECRDN